MESSISRVDRLFLEQREPEKPWPTSFRDSVGNTGLPMNNDITRPCYFYHFSLLRSGHAVPTLLPFFHPLWPRSKYVYTRVYYANFSRVARGQRRTLTKPINLAATLKFLVSGRTHVPGHSALRQSRDGN